jgi:structural maintenance of chromosome 1
MGGVYFSPTPPSKRFVYDIDQLSGGEKSLASIALQFSTAVATKSPFIMFD